MDSCPGDFDLENPAVKPVIKKIPAAFPSFLMVCSMMITNLSYLSSVDNTAPF
jgi:hypothetical protein